MHPEARSLFVGKGMGRKRAPLRGGQILDALSRDLLAGVTCNRASMSKPRVAVRRLRCYDDSIRSRRIPGCSEPPGNMKVCLLAEVVHVDPLLRPSDKVVFMVLLIHTGSKRIVVDGASVFGTCVDERTIARDAGCCRRTVIRSLCDLEKSGLITRYSRKGSLSYVTVLNALEDVYDMKTGLRLSDEARRLPRV